MAEIADLVAKRLPTDDELDRVEIFVLHYALPEVTEKCIGNIVRNTDWPFKLNVMDTRYYPKGVMAKIYNKMVKESTCKKVAFVCSDAMVPPGWLRDLMSIQLVTDGNVACTVPYYTSRPGQQGMIEPHSGFVQVPGEGMSISVSLWFDKDLLEFDEEYFLYFHDTELMKKLDREGWLFYVNTEVIVDHPIGTTTKAVFNQDELMKIHIHNDEVRRKRASVEA